MSIRNNFRHTLYASYAGYFVQAIINNFIPLLFLTFQKSFGFSYAAISALIFVNFAVQFIVDFLAAYFIDKIGYRRCIVAAHFFAFAGLCALAVLPFVFTDAYAAVLISIIIYATGSGLIEVIISPLVEACPTENKSGSMSLLHSFYCWGQMSVILLSTAFFTLVGISHWRLLSVLWALVPLANAFYLLAVPFPKILDEGKGMKLNELFKTRFFLICAVIMICAGASELAMSQWASAFAESGLKVSKTAGDLLGPCMFAVLMGTARVIYAKFSNKISLKKALLASSALCVLSYLTACISAFPILSLAGCAVCGFSVGIMWPGTFSLAAEKIPTGGTALFAMLALFGDIGCASGPAVVGFLTGAMGNSLEKGLLFGTAFPLVLIIMILLMKEKRKAP